MGKPKGKTPSLLTITTGKPTVHKCGRATPCDRCGESVVTGATCFQIPKMANGFTKRPIFCIACTSDIVAQTKTDVAAIEEAIKLCV